jgi:hypothetical protein
VAVSQLLQTLGQLFDVLQTLVQEVVGLLAPWLLLFAWLAWWLWAVNWRRAWPVLAQGAWVPVVLLMLVSALVWASLFPSACDCLGFTSVSNFWWQLGGVSLFVSLALFCGWLQTVLGWYPPEIDLEPPAPAAHDHH